MSKIQEKITSKMDELQLMMESQMHLSHTEEVAMQINNVTKYWAHMSDEDKDYVHCSQYALEERTQWNVGKEIDND